MQFLLSQCHAAFEQHSSILLTLFLAGLVGGLTHCTGMCGPFVAAQVSCNHNNDPQLKKLSGSVLLPYHLGRMTTYITLGALAALISRPLLDSPIQQWISVAFLSLAGCIFITSALPKSKNKWHAKQPKFIFQIGSTIGKIARPFMNNPQGIRGYMLGVLLGFLPCGLIFAALMAVSTVGAPTTAALAMALFTIGTFPALFLVGLSSSLIYQKWPNTLQNVARGVMIFNGFSLFILAGNMVL